MPEQKRSGRSQGVPYHPLVEALASDPNQPPKPATQLFGYPGPAAERNATRLWLDLELTNYVDVPNDAILHSRTLPEEAGTLLWVDPAATLTYSVPQQQEVQAEFLAGSIAEGNLAGAAPVGRMKLPGTIGTIGRTGTIGTIGPTIYPTYSENECPRSYISCPTEFGGGCWPTRQAWCARHVDAEAIFAPHHTVGIICQSLALPCPTDPPECLKFQSQVHPCLTQQQICTRAFICVASGGGAACPTGPWTGTTTPVIDQVGPFRPQF